MRGLLSKHATETREQPGWLKGWWVVCKPAGSPVPSCNDKSCDFHGKAWVFQISLPERAETWGVCPSSLQAPQGICCQPGLPWGRRWWDWLGPFCWRITLYAPKSFRFLVFENAAQVPGWIPGAKLAVNDLLCERRTGFGQCRLRSQTPHF